MIATNFWMYVHAMCNTTKKYYPDQMHLLDKQWYSNFSGEKCEAIIMGHSPQKLVESKKFNLSICAAAGNFLISDSRQTRWMLLPFSTMVQKLNLVCDTRLICLKISRSNTLPCLFRLFLILPLLHSVTEIFFLFFTIYLTFLCPCLFPLQHYVNDRYIFCSFFHLHDI